MENWKEGEEGERNEKLARRNSRATAREMECRARYFFFGRGQARGPFSLSEERANFLHSRRVGKRGGGESGVNYLCTRWYHRRATTAQGPCGAAENRRIGLDGRKCRGGRELTRAIIALSFCVPQMLNTTKGICSFS